jgi:ATP-dependent Clp protease ATP-binding subunit ClpA
MKTYKIHEKEITIEATSEAVELLAKLSYTPEYGARPVRRKIQDLVEDPIAEKILAGEFKKGDTIKIGRLPDKEELTFIRVELKVKKESGKKKLTKV